MWGSNRQALEKSNRQAKIADGFSEQPDGDDMDVEEIPRAPATPGTEDINSSEGALLRFFWQDMFRKGEDWRIETVFGTQLLHRFGPNISSKAVRHALLSAFSMEDEYDRFALSGIEHSVLAIYYTQQAINEHAYVEILYAAFLMAAYSINEPDPDLSAEEQTNVMLHHANAYTFCMKNLSIDVEESCLMTIFLYGMWRRVSEMLKKFDFRNKVFLRMNQFTKSCVELMPDFSNWSPAGASEWWTEFDFDALAEEVAEDLQRYLNCWYHFRLLKDGDIEEINQLGSNIRDTLLFYLSSNLSMLQSKDLNGGDDDREEFWDTEMSAPFLEYAVLVERSLSLSPDVRIRYWALKVARHTPVDFWQSFLSALLSKSLPQDEGVFLSFQANLSEDMEMSDSVKVRFLDLLRTAYWLELEDAQREFIVEFFEAACETGDALNLEINGRGFYDCMQLLGRDIYEGQDIDYGLE